MCAEDTVLGEQMMAEGACKRHHAGKPTAVAKCLDLAHCCRISDGQHGTRRWPAAAGSGGSRVLRNRTAHEPTPPTENRRRH